MKTSNLTHIHGSRPILNSFNFRHIYFYSMLRDNITQKYDLIFAKCALLKITIEFTITQHLQNMSNMYMNGS